MTFILDRLVKTRESPPTICPVTVPPVIVTMFSDILPAAAAVPPPPMTFVTVPPSMRTSFFCAEAFAPDTAPPTTFVTVPPLMMTWFTLAAPSAFAVKPPLMLAIEPAPWPPALSVLLTMTQFSLESAAPFVLPP